MHGPSAPIVYSFESFDTLQDSLSKFIIRAQRDSIEKKGRFTVAISGGSLPKQLNGLIGRAGVKWDKWSVHLNPHRILAFHLSIADLPPILRSYLSIGTFSTQTNV